MATVTGNTVTAVDLNEVDIISQDKYSASDDGGLSQADRQFQENRRQRKIRKINFFFNDQMY